MKDTARELKFIEKFDKTNPDLYNRIYFDLSKKYFDVKKLVLNIGCWIGNLEALFKVDNFQVIGIDIEKRALKVAKDSNPHALFTGGSILNLPFKDNTFDVITLFTVLEHLPEGTEAESFAEIKRVLVSGGSLILTTPSDNLISNIMDIAYWTIGHRHYKLNSLKRMLESLGFKITEAELKGGLLSDLSISFFYAFKYIFKANIYRNNFVEKVLRFEYQKPGYRDIYLVATK